MTEVKAAAGGHVDIDLPSGWHRTVHDGPVVMVARPRRWIGGSAPTLTVTRSRTLGVGTLGGYCDAQLAGVVASVGGHLVHLASGHRPRPHLDLTLAIELLGVDLTVTQHHLVEPLSPEGSEPGCLALVATAIAADHDWPGLAPVLVAAVRSIRVRGT